MAGFLHILLEGARHCDLSGQRIIVAVSGGADSVALLRGMLNLQSDLGVSCIAAHLNHSVRGAAADEDEAWLCNLTRDLGVELICERLDIAESRRVEKRGFEEAARNARYAFLQRVAALHNSTAIAVAHHANDQAETVLHQIVRGTGLAGLGGMPWSRSLSDGSCLVRPLLATSRQQIEDWLREIGQDWRIDGTNADAAFTRNRIRHQLIPLLESEFNPQVQTALRRLADNASETQLALQCVAERILSSAMEDQQPQICRLNCNELARWPRHLIRETLSLLWKRQNWPRRRMGFEDWDRLAEVVVAGGRVSLPAGIDARRRNALLVIECPPSTGESFGP